MKGAEANEYDNESSGKSAAGTVPFYKTPRFHHLPRRRPFQQDEQGDGERQDRQTNPQRRDDREGGKPMRKGGKIYRAAIGL